MADGRTSESRFAAYVGGLAKALGHADRVAPLRSYCTGLILPGERKSVEPMAARVEPGRGEIEDKLHREISQSITAGPWRSRPSRAAPISPSSTPLPAATMPFELASATRRKTGSLPMSSAVAGRLSIRRKWQIDDLLPQDGRGVEEGEAIGEDELRLIDRPRERKQIACLTRRQAVTMVNECGDVGGKPGSHPTLPAPPADNRPYLGDAFVRGSATTGDLGEDRLIIAAEWEAEGSPHHDKPSRPALCRSERSAYAGHIVGSRKGEVHRAYDADGAEAAWTLGAKLGIKESSLKTWLSFWRKTAKPASAPAKPKAGKKTAKAEAPAVAA